MPEPRARGMILRSGVHREMEDAADEMLRVQLSGITRHSEKSDVLTPWKEQARRSREVYSSEGVPDGSLRRGIFTRELNPTHSHLNSVQAMKPPKLGRSHGANVWDSE